MNAAPTARPSRLRLVHAALCLLTAGGVLLFAWRQNHGAAVGGPLSLPKAVWLACALLGFFVFPFTLGQNRRLSPGVRRVFGAVFLSFAARGVVELVVLCLTREWRCIYGISHDAFTALLALALAACARPATPLDRRTLRFVPILLTMLAVEAYFAWRFSLIASPAQGIYFAANAPEFQSLNDLTVIANFATIIALGWFSHLVRDDL